VRQDQTHRKKISNSFEDNIAVGQPIHSFQNSGILFKRNIGIQKLTFSPHG
jgi:hypothetical protein